MSRWRATFIVCFSALVVSIGLWLSLRPGSILAHVELSVADRLARDGRRTPANPKLFFLAIDNSSAVSLDANTDLKTLFGLKEDSTPEARALYEMSQQWPWPRSVYGRVLDRLMAAGAKVVVFDMLFPTEGEGDAIFRDALERYRDRVVLGSNFTTLSPEDTGITNVTHTLPSESLILSRKPVDDRVGHVNFWPDTDGVIRRTQFDIGLSQLLGASVPEDSVCPSLAAQTMRKAGLGYLVPGDQASHAFRYTAGPHQEFAPRSLFEIFVPAYWERNFQSGAVLKDAIVVIGAFGNWQHDEHRTPFGLMSGPEIQLNVINAAIHGEYLKSPSPLGVAAIWIIMGVASAACAILCSRPLVRFGVVALLAVSWAAAQWPIFNEVGLLLPAVGPVVAISLIALSSLAYDFVLGRAEQYRLGILLSERKRAQEMLQAANAQLEQRVSERTSELRDANQVLTGLIEEKDVLLKEIHHRVKNNLQVISSLLNLQSSYIEDPAAQEIFTESRNRVRSMALIHEKLYQSQDLSRIDFQDYLRSLTNGLQSSFGSRSRAVRIAVDVDGVDLSVDSAVPCGLIVNELVTNSFKYAFRDGRSGEIQIALKRAESSRLRLTVADNGVGFPKNVDFRNTESLGMQIVNTLTEQLDGTIALRNGVGTTFEIEFPETSPSKS